MGEKYSFVQKSFLAQSKNVHFLKPFVLVNATSTVFEQKSSGVKTKYCLKKALFRPAAIKAKTVIDKQSIKSLVSISVDLSNESSSKV